MIQRLRSQPHSDSGATLILVLLLIFTVSITSVAILRLSYTTMRAAAVTGGVAERQADEAAAMTTGIQGVQAQINNTRYRDVGMPVSDTPGVPGGFRCDPVQSTGPNVTTQGYVTSCERDPAAPDTVNTPLNSVMSVGTPASGGTPAQDGGIGIQLSGTGALTVNGDVYSTTAIGNPSNPTNPFLANGFIESADGCTGNIVSTRPNGVDNCRTPSPVLADPGYSWPSSGTTLTKADLPAISCAGSVVTFTPGYYGSAALLNQIFSDATCQSKVLYFPAGDYFFDFKDGQSPGAVGAPIWNISDSSIRMVAGAKNDAPVDYWAGPDAPSTANVYRACKSPTTNEQDGANFIFGGRSQLNITAGRVAICGSYRNAPAPASAQPQRHQPPTAIFGANADIGTLTPTGPTPRYSTALTGVSADSSCDVAFSDPTRAQFWQSAAAATATATLDGAAGVADTRRCMRATDFSLPADIPAGSVLVNASAMVRAGVSSTADSNKLIDLVVGGTGAAAAGGDAFSQFTTGNRTLSQVTSATDTSAWADDTVHSFDLTEGLYDQVYNEGLNDLSLLLRTWKSATGGDYTVGVDTMQIALQWITPNVANQNKASYGVAGSNGYGIWSSAAGIRNLSVAFYTTGDPTPTFSADQVVVANGVTTVGADFTVENNNCVAETNYPTSGCAFLRTANNSTVDLHLHGALYAPKAAVQIRHTGISDAPVVDNGVLVRKLYLQDAAMLPAYRTAGGSVFGIGWPGDVQTYAWTFACQGSCGAITRTTPAGYPNLGGPTRTLKGATRTTYSNGPQLYTGQSADSSVNIWQNVAPYETP